MPCVGERPIKLSKNSSNTASKREPWLESSGIVNHVQDVHEQGTTFERIPKLVLCQDSLTRRTAAFLGQHLVTENLY